VPPVAVMLQCVADAGCRESRACSEVLVNASLLVGERGLEDHKGGRSVGYSYP
jgi:hypothetical protein